MSLRADSTRTLKKFIEWANAGKNLTRGITPIYSLKEVYDWQLVVAQKNGIKRKVDREQTAFGNAYDEIYGWRQMNLIIPFRGRFGGYSLFSSAKEMEKAT